MKSAIRQASESTVVELADEQPLPIEIATDLVIGRLVREIEERARPKPPQQIEERPLTRRAPYTYD